MSDCLWTRRRTASQIVKPFNTRTIQSICGKRVMNKLSMEFKYSFPPQWTYVLVPLPTNVLKLPVAVPFTIPRHHTPSLPLTLPGSGRRPASRGVPTQREVWICTSLVIIGTQHLFILFLWLICLGSIR